ncbi:uncharacterized protein I303_101031 [Kwoniella dejecticola CBS 10117]|uniref:Uncharacterized protein n=1 Tax=Kwoniella dejecticola CBS 10117 TaxID=1296121 RepID=A0A1A6AGK4_9TREE|nr:uncharacterized protein I303_01034 [Kwoniella dejecticola CBS 10117]OBR89209.1 hypothetical protein I303_01034 [Kwoniella dejecticola CBS 10117]
MHFSTRNAFYLRASNYRVIPLFLYLDERHADWMSERVLQLVISALQSKISELLFTSRGTKKHKVHVERGEGYQYCYFLRTTTRTEVVLLKEKSYSLRPPTPPPEAALEDPTSKSKASASSAKTSKTPRRSRTRSRSVTTQLEEVDEGGSPPLQPMDNAGQDVIDEDGVRVKAEPMDYDADRTESMEETNIKDWKPDVDVSYKGFGTSSVQLVLIIEPYPPLAPSQYAPPSSRLSSRSASIASARSRSRSKQGTGAIRYSSTSLSVAPGVQARSQSAHAPNMRNASRSVSAVPNSRRGGTVSSVTPFGREDSSTPGPSGSASRRRMSQTPLFMPRDTPFDEDEEDEEAHEAYEEALREGRMRLPSVNRPAGDESGLTRMRDDDDDLDDIPESIMDIGERLVRNSQIEEGVVRVQGGWEERAEGEESAVMGKEEPGD